SRPRTPGPGRHRARSAPGPPQGRSTWHRRAAAGRSSCALGSSVPPDLQFVRVSVDLPVAVGVGDVHPAGAAVVFDLGDYGAVRKDSAGPEVYDHHRAGHHGMSQSSRSKTSMSSTSQPGMYSKSTRVPKLFQPMIRRRKPRRSMRPTQTSPLRGHSKVSPTRISRILTVIPALLPVVYG